MKEKLVGYKWGLTYLVGVVLLSLTIYTLFNGNKMDKQHLKVLFPLFYLKNDVSILNPLNTETTQEYYLLENISAGLVRDSLESPRGYEPLLAADWWQSSENEYVFKIKSGIKWSDGSPILLDQIANSIRNHSRQKARHSLYLTKLKEVLLDKKENSIKLVFKTPVNEGLVHELSLADSGIFHDSSPSNGWGVTSGPFYVSSYTPVKSLTLTKNEYYEGSVKGNISNVELYFPEKLENYLEEIKTGDYDLYEYPYFPKRKGLVENLNEKKTFVESHENLIFYFAFVDLNSSAKKSTNRKHFSQILRSSPIQPPDGMKVYDQMIPHGFKGSLLKEDKDKVYSKDLPPNLESLKILVPKHFNGATEFLSSLVKAFEVSGVKCEVVFSNETYNENDIFAKLMPFKGNQRDSIGSWAFLYSGPLSQFELEASALIQRVVTTQEKKERDDLLKKIHSIALSEAHAVPILIERSTVAVDNDIDLINWNKFDFRLRFYEVVKK